jgi:hypothetical protein
VDVFHTRSGRHDVPPRALYDLGLLKKPYTKQLQL